MTIKINFDLLYEISGCSSADTESSSIPMIVKLYKDRAVIPKKWFRVNRNGLAKELGYHSYTHLRRPRMKQRWKRKNKSCENSNSGV